MELPRRDLHRARGLGGPVAALERGAEGDGHLAEDLAGRARADDALDAVDQLGDLDAPREHDEQRTFVALVHGVFARRQAQIGSRLGQARQFLGRHRGQEGNVLEVLNGDHARSLGWRHQSG
jgi:hypothetical protein